MKRVVRWLCALAGGLPAVICGAPTDDEMVVRRNADSLKIEVHTTIRAGEVALHLHSDRNARVPRFSDVSPLQPPAWPEFRKAGPESWFPVIDIVVDDAMEAVAELGDVPVDAQVSWNGWVWREKSPATPVMKFPAARMLQWENTLWSDRGGVQLARFYVRRPVKNSTLTLRLLAPGWSGRIELVSRGPSGRETVLRSHRIEGVDAVASSRPSGRGLEPTRLHAALAEVVDYTLRNRVSDPHDPMRGGLYVFYDLDARTFRTSHWLWSWGPSVALLLDARRQPGVAARFGEDRLVAVAREIGEASLRTVPREPHHPARGIPLSRWDRAPAFDFGHEQAITPCDGAFLAAWAWVRLGEVTGDPKWREACRELVAAIDRLMNDFPVPPQNYFPDYGRWDNKVIDEAGFGVELFAELHRVGGGEALRESGRRYIEQHLNALGRDDGLWDRVYFLDGRPNRPTMRMTRGLGWPMEGLLAAHRLLPEGGRYLDLARRMAAPILAAQQPEGWWGHRFDQPADAYGVGMKDTALWCWLLYELHAHTGEPRDLAAARRALAWLLDQQYFGDDERARGGHVEVSPHSAVGPRPWFRVASTYGGAFFGLALLKELQVQVGTMPTTKPSKS